MVPDDVPTLARLPVEEDLTACPELGLEVLATEEMEEDLEAPLVTLEDLVAVEVLVDDDIPLLDLLIEALLAPVLREREPSPLLDTDPVVEILGR